MGWLRANARGWSGNPAEKVGLFRVCSDVDTLGPGDFHALQDSGGSRGRGWRGGGRLLRSNRALRGRSSGGAVRRRARDRSRGSNLEGARLRGVKVTLAEVPSVEVTLDEIEVTYSGGERTVELRGGAVAAVGAREVILHQVERWRSRYASGAASGRRKSEAAGGQPSPACASAGRTTPRRPPRRCRPPTCASHARTTRSSLSAGEASAAFGRASVEIQNGKARLVRHAGVGYRVAELGADRVEAQLTVPAKAVESGAASGRPVSGAAPAPAPKSPCSTERRPRAARDRSEWR